MTDLLAPFPWGVGCRAMKSSKYSRICTVPLLFYVAFESNDICRGKTCCRVFDLHDAVSITKGLSIESAAHIKGDEAEK